MHVYKDLSYGPCGIRNALDLYLPENLSVPVPLVVCLHGGGWKSGDKSSYAWAAERLVQQGFAVACIHYRFWPEAPYPAALDDAQRAVRWLRQQATTYHLDPTRVGAMGTSAGGYLAAYLALTPNRACIDPALAQYSAQIKCVVDCCGPVDFPTMMTTASAQFVEGFMGMPLTPENEAAYRQASPIHLVQPVPPPFLIIHGTADLGLQPGEVPHTISQRFCQALRDAGGEATFLPLEGVGHDLLSTQTTNATDLWQVALTFFQKHL